MISFRARLVRFFAKQLFRQLGGDTDIPHLRAKWDKLAARSRPPSGVRIKYVYFAGVECEWIVPSGCQDAPVLYYLHGGAYVSGSARTHRPMVAHLARQAGMRALLPNYRLAPENPYPAGLEDCLAVYRALLADGHPASGIAIAGDSAGGGMTMAVLLSLRDAGALLPKAAVLLSPWLDLTGSGESIRTRATQDPLFRPEEMPQAAAHYAPASMLTDPLVSPIYADVHGLPPILVQVGDHEILLSDATRIADSISAADGRVTLQVWPGMWHVFQYFVGRMPEAQRALADVASFLRRQLGIEAESVTEKAAA